jgi:hypothetical protein
MITLQTNEPIAITVNCRDNMLLVQVDGHDYAVIDNVRHEDEVDLLELADWINNTYYDGDYLCNQYIAPRLDISEFRV